MIFLMFKSKMALKISTRNLTRQFRRNLLLGICIAVGMAILVITTSFTSGLTDIIFNKVMIYMTGHIRVEGTEYTSRKAVIIRDRPRAEELIRQNVEGIKSIDEEVSAFGRAIGNGKTSMVALVGISRDADFYKETNLEEGDPRDIYKDDAFPGILLYKNMANDLNVRMTDTVRIRFQTIYGSDQVIQYKIVGLIPSENMFMDMAAFVDVERLRKDLQLRPEECLGLNIVVNYPEDAAKVIAQANKLYASLGAQVAGVRGILTGNNISATGDVYAIKLTAAEKTEEIAKAQLRFISGDYASFHDDKSGIVLTEKLASELKAGIGTKLVYHYIPRFGGDEVQKDVVVKGIITVPDSFGDRAAFANEKVFLDTYFWNLPREYATAAAEAPLYKALLPEWELLERSPDTDSMMKKMLRLNKETWTGYRIDVQTMYETASMITDFQFWINFVSVTAVFILFFVIVIGVVNTMRMSIRERTREIGTNRAIGMQSRDVRLVFVFEIVLLAFLSCVAGIILGFGLMGLLGLITFDLKDNPFSMFFVNKHLYFMPTIQAIYLTLGVIVFMSFCVAWTAARRAAKMSAAEALRHYE